MTTLNRKQVISEEAKETAKKIRQALKANFPGVKFSVTTQVYTGGSSVNVSWTDLPLRDDVEAVVNKFKSGSFNGMEDIYEYGAYEYQGKLYSGAKYLFCRRELSPEYKEQIKNYMKENYSNIDENDYYYYSHFNQAEAKMIEEMKTPAQVEEVASVLENEINETVTTQETAANGEITFEVGTGAKGNGIEITFTSKPSEEVRNELKANGYRWGGKSRASIWWAINTKESLALAERLASVGAENNHNSNEAETLEVLEVIPTNEIPEIPETVETEQILVNDSKLIGRKVFGQWGVMSGFDYGVITGETIYNEVIVKWEEDGHQEYIELKNLVIVDDNTSLDPVGVYLMPMEEAKKETPVTIETKQPEQPQNVKPAKVLDFTSKFKQKQEQREIEKAKDHFLTNVLPYMTKDDQFRLLESTGDNEKFNSIMSELMIKTAFLKASDDMTQQYN